MDLKCVLYEPPTILLFSPKIQNFLPSSLLTSYDDDNDNEKNLFGSSKLAVLIIRDVKKELEYFFYISHIAAREKSFKPYYEAIKRV
jgi:hypothetical protein